MNNIADAVFLTWLKTENGFRDLKPLPRHRWAGIQKMMFTHALVLGRMGDEIGYDNRWCFSSYEKAKTALDNWNGDGEPMGWHRHPDTGRRRVEGDESKEYVAL